MLLLFLTSLPAGASGIAAAGRLVSIPDSQVAGLLFAEICAPGTWSLTTPSVASASMAAPGQAPATAKAFAATIDHHYNALHSLSAVFDQQYDGMGMHRSESGVLLLKKAGRLGAGQMRWTYAKPAGKLFILDGHYAYFYTPGQVEIPRVEAKKLDDLRSPLAFLLGHAALATQLDDLALAPAAGGQWTLSGVPHGMEKRIATLAITASATGTIAAMRVEEVDGSVNTFRLTEEQANVPAGPAEFLFIPPPGTHIVDGLPPL